MNEIIKVDPKEYGLEEVNVKSINEAFMPKIAERNALAKMYEDLITRELNEGTCTEAGILKKQLVKVRTGIAGVHKTQKAYFLAAGRYVDAWKNKETLPIVQMEERLVEIEKHFELKEQARLEELQKKRAIALSDYVDDANERRLCDMEEDVWQAYLAAKKSQYEDIKAAEKAAADKAAAEAKAAEEKRIQEAKAAEAERKRIEAENKRLKAEAAKKEKQRLAEEQERKRLEKIEYDKRQEEERKRQAAAEKERQEREKQEAEVKAKADAAIKAAEEATKKAEQAKAAAEAALKAKKAKEVEEKRIAAENAEKAHQAELNKGDAAKVKDLIKDLEQLKTKYSFKSKKNKAKYAAVGTLLDKVTDYIKK